jgi:hypothetical protein
MEKDDTNKKHMLQSQGMGMTRNVLSLIIDERKNVEEDLSHTNRSIRTSQKLLIEHVLEQTKVETSPCVTEPPKELGPPTYVCWGEGKDATLRSRPSLQPLVRRRQSGKGHPSQDSAL